MKLLTLTITAVLLAGSVAHANVNSSDPAKKDCHMRTQANLGPTKQQVTSNYLRVVANDSRPAIQPANTGPSDGRR